MVVSYTNVTFRWYCPRFSATWGRGLKSTCERMKVRRILLVSIWFGGYLLNTKVLSGQDVVYQHTNNGWITIVNRLLTVHIWLCFFNFLRWVPQFFNFGIWIKLMAHLILVLKSKMEILIENHDLFIVVYTIVLGIGN